MRRYLTHLGMGNQPIARRDACPAPPRAGYSAPWLHKDFNWAVDCLAASDWTPRVVELDTAPDSPAEEIPEA